MTDHPSGSIELYQSDDGSIKIDVRTDGDTVWLTRQQMALLFGRDVKTIGKHIGNTVREELADMATVANFATVQLEGDRTVERRVEHYNLDMVLSVGYRVKSSEGIRFRRWATGVLKDYLIKDGNKRSAALFVTFLARNELLINADGEPKFTNNALAALTLMVAMSDPTEKDLMVALITKMLAENKPLETDHA